MSDLISRQSALDNVSAIDTSIIPFSKAKEYADETIAYVTKILEDMPDAEPEQRWTPVSEALPEEDEEVLVTVRFDGIKDLKSSTYVEVAHQIDGEWSSYTDEYKVMRHRHHVLAWKPLPEPWENNNE